MVREKRHFFMFFLAGAILASGFSVFGESGKNTAIDREMQANIYNSKDPVGFVDYAARKMACDQAFDMRNMSQSAGAKWENMGPAGFGRVADIKLDPTNDQIVYCGSASGGIWKSTNGGTSWTQIFNNQKTQCISDIEFDPTNHNTIWVATGEGNAGGGAVMYPGAGIYKSTDAGATWTNMGLDTSYYIGRISIDSTNPNIIFVAVNGCRWGKNPQRGVYRTKDGGTTWQLVKFVSDSTGCADVRIWPSNHLRVFANFWTVWKQPYARTFVGPECRVWRSDDGGDTWVQMGTAEGLPTTDIGKNTMDICKSNPNVMYIVYLNSSNTMKGIWKSTNGGMNWSQTGAPTTDIFAFYAQYFCQLRVNPYNANDVIILGISSMRSTDGGATYTGNSPGTHADDHAFCWSSQNQNTCYLGNDGGIYKSTTGASGTFTQLGMGTLAGGGISQAQIYFCDIAPDNANYRYSGLQDNGQIMTATGGDANSSWSAMYGGDGMYVRCDHGNSNYVIGAMQFGGFSYSSNRGASAMTALPALSGRCYWAAPVEFDAPKGRTYLGSQYVYRATRGTTTFTQISNDLTNGDHTAGNYPYGTITTIGANNGACYAGTDDGNVFVTKDGTAASPVWTKIRVGDLGAPPANSPYPGNQYRYDGFIRQIEVDKSSADGSVAYVAISYFRWGPKNWKPKLYKLTNWGLGGVGSADWQDISGDLPAYATTNRVENDTSAARKNWLYCATDYGTFYSINNGVNWNWLGDNTIPTIVNNDFSIHYGTNYLYVATYGRGLWRLNLSNVTPVKPPDNGNTVVFKGAQMLKNFPNPVMTRTEIQFKVKDQQQIFLAIYDLRGRQVRMLMNNKRVNADELQTATWDKTDDNGGRVATGNYICRVMGEKVTLAKVIIVK
jgi:photosystem II stability/assembly factor-like uncharacterized protein